MSMSTRVKYRMCQRVAVVLTTPERVGACAYTLLRQNTHIHALNQSARSAVA